MYYFTKEYGFAYPAFQFVYFKAENLVLRARSESVGFAEIVNTDRMVGTKAQSKNQRLCLIIS